MRKLQYIFNVLMASGVLKLEWDTDEKGNLVNGHYTIKGTDPFYIDNKEWYRMQEEFNNFYPPVEAKSDDAWPEQL